VKSASKNSNAFGKLGGIGDLGNATHNKSESEGVEVEDEANEFSIPRFLRDGGPGFVTT
jgi:hypothetical protein